MEDDSYFEDEEFSPIRSLLGLLTFSTILPISVRRICGSSRAPTPTEGGGRICTRQRVAEDVDPYDSGEN